MHIELEFVKVTNCVLTVVISENTGLFFSAPFLVPVSFVLLLLPPHPPQSSSLLTFGMWFVSSGAPNV